MSALWKQRRGEMDQASIGRAMQIIESHQKLIVASRAAYKALAGTSSPQCETEAGCICQDPGHPPCYGYVRFLLKEGTA